MNRWKLTQSALCAGVLAVAGCATTPEDLEVNRLSALERAVAEKDAQNAQLQSQLSNLQSQGGAVGQIPSQTVTYQGDGLLPPNAKPGECWARVYIPPTFDTQTREVVVQDASERVEVIPAQYEWAEEQVLVQEASSRMEVVPAEFGWDEERVEVKSASTVWKKGRGPIERIDNLTGEIMCLIETPAEYRTVKKKVLVRPASTREVSIPAEYKTVRVKKLASAAREVKTEIPAKYDTITERKQVTEAQMEWRPILCETNVTAGLVTRLQTALQREGFNPGAIDGVYGSETLAAVRGYQRKKGIAHGHLTTETLQSLGVRM